MLDLSPIKVLIVLVVAMVLLGPDKLPQVARQLGAGWRRLQAFREQVDRDVREHVPDLPSSQEIARYARSPAALLERLARVDEPLVEDPGAEPAPSGEAWPEDPGVHPPVEPALPPAPDDPSLN
ncbi:MAG: Sec-independent protein translocase subunit TatA/TatB [Acidimicrobiales bacterium]